VRDAAINIPSRQAAACAVVAARRSGTVARAMPHALGDELAQQQLEVELRVRVCRVEADGRLEVGDALIDRRRRTRTCLGSVREREDAE
jgi:hypothetical protein